MLTDRLIGILAGGVSAEREVSLRSGKAVFSALQKKGYKVIFLDLQYDIASLIKKEGIEIAFLVLHGGWGENGAIQGLLEIMNIPYTGSGVLASALAMDKEISKKLFLSHGLSVPNFKVIKKDKAIASILKDTKKTFDYLSQRVDFPLPWVIKPATEGSSIGVNILKGEEDISRYLENAFSYSDRIIIEKYIKGKEIQIGILEDKILGGVEVRPSLEFYSYEAKYTAGLTQYILPPEVDANIYDKLKIAGLKAHQALNCEGATRVDLILDDMNNIYVLEVNTIPGMTETSLLPKIANLVGMDFETLVEEILRLSLIKFNILK
ncbi:MAG: D-alanine--D-alanine ligase [Thermodesulfovibrionales bacterium]|nr:D-alanine--D-alanine ligase [Thermodesulfovibrionales bacterium]